MISLKREWSKPSTILFATEYPANEKNFAFALARAKDSGADLILLHVTDDPARSSTRSASSGHGAAASATRLFDPLVQRAKDVGIRCQVTVRNGDVAEEILNVLHERKVDRIVMGAHTPGPVGKLLVGSVAETVLRRADVPVTIVGPYVEEGSYRNFATRTILCSVSAHGPSPMVVRFAAELAAQFRARLILQEVIPPQECAEMAAQQTIRESESDLLAMIPDQLRGKVPVQTRVVLGDPIEELLYQGRTQRANLIVMGARNATHFAAETRAAVIYKALAYARCPVTTLSPVLLTDGSPQPERPSPAEINYVAGVV